MKAEVIINGTSLDLYEDSAIAYSYKNIEIGNLSSRYISTTNKINLPSTQKNRTVLGFTDNINSLSTFPFRVQDVKLRMSGIEILSEGYCTVEYNQKFSLQILTKDAQFYSALSGKNLSDLDWSDMGGWTNSDIDTARLSTSGKVAIVYYQGGQYVHNLNFFLPCYYYFSLIEKIITYAGFTFSGAIFSDPVYKNIVCTPVNKFKYSDGSAVTLSSPVWSSLVNEKISLIDLFKDFCVRFSLLISTNGNNMLFKTTEEVISDYGSALDWSKIPRTGNPNIKFLSNYARNNYFKYNDVGSFGGYKNISTYGQGNIIVDSEILTNTNTFFNSVFNGLVYFAGVLGLTGSQVFCSAADIYAFSGAVDISDFLNEPPFTLLNVRAKDGFESQIRFDGTNLRNDYRVGYFISPTLSPQSSSFQFYIDTYYKSLSEAIKQPKVITKEYLLSVIDVLNISPHKMIFDTDAYYLINTASNFVPGKPTKVELFKVG